MRLVAIALVLAVALSCLVSSSKLAYKVVRSGEVGTRQRLRRRDCSQTGGVTPNPKGPNKGGGSQKFTGNLTNYKVGKGACGKTNTNEELVCALNNPQYTEKMNGDVSAACGKCILIHGDAGEVVVKVVDECPECRKGSLDLSPAAFAKATKADGLAKNISWEFVPCGSSSRS